MSYIHPAQAIIPFGQNKVSTESSKIKRIFIVGQSGHGKSTSAFKDPPGSCVYVDGENNAPPEFSTRSDIKCKVSFLFIAPGSKPASKRI